MDTIPSTIFRTQYSALTKTTAVTAHGRIIGVWTPGPYNVMAGGSWTEPVPEQPSDHQFNTRPFTPVPKK